VASAFSKAPAQTAMDKEKVEAKAKIKILFFMTNPF
jgi:hypothetical protein